MTEEIKQDILINIETILNLDISKRFLIKYENFENSPFLDQSKFIEFEFKVRHSCVRMKEVLNSKYGDYIQHTVPYTFAIGDPVRTINIQSDFSSLCSHLITDYFDFAITHLEFIVYYLVSLNLWNKASDEENYFKVESFVKARAQYELNILESNDLTKKLRDSIDNLETFSTDLNAKLLVIDNHLSEISVKESDATTSKSNIEKIQIQVEGLRDNVLIIKDQINDELQRTKKEIEIKSLDYDQIVVKINERLSEILKSNKEISDKQIEVSHYMKLAEDLYNSLMSKKENIDLLQQFSSDKALGARFHERKVEIEKSVKFWKWSSLAVLLGSVTWSGIVFKYFAYDSDIAWLDFLVNSIKTIPPYFILGFAVNQYRKERNFQEEYAFKSAISMTLTAYSNMLGQSEENKNNAQIEMLQNSISSIYTQPRVHTESNRPFFSFNSKDVSESLKQLVEAIKTVKP